MKFTYHDYKKFLRFAKKETNITSFEKSNGKNGILLRHDVDFYPTFAHDMFKIEKELNVTSTYFFLTTAQTYNPNSLLSKRIITEISESGFEIGLHFTVLPYEKEKVITERILWEVAVLESIIQKPITNICSHNTREETCNIYFPEFINISNNNNVFISDSRMDFKEIDLYKIIDISKTELVQVIIHPLYWADKERTFNDIINKFQESMLEWADRELWRTNSFINKRCRKFKEKKIDQGINFNT